MDTSSFSFATLDTKSNILFHNQNFENFFKSKNKLLENIAVIYGKTNGHSLGFEQIRQILTECNGKLQIKSYEGIGTTIVLSFPKFNNLL